MSTIQDLEREIQRFENLVNQKDEQMEQLVQKCEKALDLAIHAYRVDHFGYIWQYNCETKEYVKSNMRVCTPEVADRALHSRHIADRAIEGRHLQDCLIEGRMIKDKTIEGRSIRNNAIGPEQIKDNSITGDNMEPMGLPNGKLADNAVARRNIQPKAINNDKLDSDAVDTPNLKNGAVTPPKLSEETKNFLLALITGKITDPLNQKYTNITNELYSLVRSLQVGGIAISQQFGDREDIGISQKTLTKALGRFWQEMSNITGKTYMDFTLSVVPATTYSEGSAVVDITADCSGSISDFDSIKIYVDNVVVAESSDLEVLNTQVTVSKSATVKAVGVILGKTITKNSTITKEVPFFMGSGSVYTDVINEDDRKVLDGTLEGEYDVTVKNNGEHLFVIIPISRKEEFRRCKMDMNGFEIPFEATETSDYIICKSLNVYTAGTYNIDIDINS